MDLPNFLRNKTGENAVLILCPECGADHFINPGQALKECDVCSSEFIDPRDEEE